MLVLFAAIAMISVGVTLAANDLTGSATNVVVFGDIKIDLVDEYEGNGGNPPEVNPGQTVDKLVSVKNVGDHDCYVRILVNKTWTAKDNTSIADLITLNINSAYWYTQDSAITQWDGDYYQIYYYKDILAPGVQAQPLFRNFTIADYSNDIANVGKTSGHIKVMGQAVQSDYVSVGTGSDALIQKNTAGYIVNWSNEIAQFRQ